MLQGFGSLPFSGDECDALIFKDAIDLCRKAKQGVESISPPPPPPPPAQPKFSQSAVSALQSWFKSTQAMPVFETTASGAPSPGRVSVAASGRVSPTSARPSAEPAPYAPVMRPGVSPMKGSLAPDSSGQEAYDSKVLWYVGAVVGVAAVGGLAYWFTTRKSD